MPYSYCDTMKLAWFNSRQNMLQPTVWESATECCLIYHIQSCYHTLLINCVNVLSAAALRFVSHLCA